MYNEYIEKILFYIILCYKIIAEREPMIINVAHTKGGVGKTTIAVNLAIEMNSDLFDLDNQNSSYNFSLLSDIPRSIHFWKDREMLKKIIQVYRDNPDKHIIIDSGGYDSNISREIILNSNIIITPITVSQTEVDGLQKFYIENVEIALQANPDIRPYILLNRISHYDKKDAEDLITFIKSAVPDYKVLKTSLGARKDYKKAFSEGKSVVEYVRTSPASKEILSLKKEIEQIIKTIAKEK